MTSIDIGTETDFGTQAEDMDAINVFMRTTKIRNNAAFPIKDEFIRWYDKLGMWDRTMSSAVYDTARTYRNKFNLTNTTSEAQREDVRQVITTGITTEEMQGGKKPVILSTGEVGTQVKKPTTGKNAPPGVKASTTVAITYETIRQGSSGAAVIAWQKILGVTADGKFGPGTKAATVAWQKAHSLTADGVVGPNTWKAAKPVAEKATGFLEPGQPVTPLRPVIGKGSSGPAVSEWQGLMRISPVTGFFGDLTVTKTMAFQKANGLPPTGKVDQKTWDAAAKGNASFAPPGPKPVPFAPTPNAPAKPAATSPQTPKAKAAATVKKAAVAIKQAGMFDVANWPLGVKILAVGGTVAGIAYSILGGKRV